MLKCHVSSHTKSTPLKFTIIQPAPSPTTHCTPSIITYTKIFRKGYSRWSQWFELQWRWRVMGREPSHILSAHTSWSGQWAKWCKSRYMWNWRRLPCCEGLADNVAVGHSQYIPGSTDKKDRETETAAWSLHCWCWYCAFKNGTIDLNQNFLMLKTAEEVVWQLCLCSESLMMT